MRGKMIQAMNGKNRDRGQYNPSPKGGQSEGWWSDDSKASKLERGCESKKIQAIRDDVSK